MQQQLLAAQAKNSNKINGKRAYLADASREIEDKHADLSKAHRNGVRKLSVKRLGKAWRKLPFARRHKYNQQAKTMRHERAKQDLKRVRLAKDKLTTYMQEKQRKKDEKESALLMSDHVFDHNTMQELQDSWESFHMPFKDVLTSEDVMTEKVGSVTEQELDELDYMRKNFLGPVGIAREIKEWTRQVCRRPHAFYKSVLIMDIGGTTSYFAIRVPMERPHEVSLQPLQRVPGPIGILTSLQPVFLIKIQTYKR